MISTGAFLNEMDASNKQPTVAEKFAAVWEKKNAKAARAGGVSLMALSLAACGGSSDSTSSTSSGTSTSATVTPVSSALTTGQDTVTGTAGDDTISATRVDSVLNTWNSGDVIDGGAGTDSLTAIISASVTPASGAITNVENLTVTAVGGATIDFSSATANFITGVTSVTNVGSTGATLFTDMTGLAEMTVNNTAAATTFEYNTALLSGSDDTLTVNLNGATAAVTIGTNGDADGDYETLVINASGAASDMVAGTGMGGDAATVTVNASVALDLGSSAQFPKLATFDASGSTGGVTLVLGADGVTGTSNAKTITMGSGADTVDVGLLAPSEIGVLTINAGAGNDTVDIDDFADTTFVINGGDGTDTLETAAAVTTANGQNISGFETFKFGEDTGTQSMIAFDELDITTIVAAAATTTYTNVEASTTTLKVSDATTTALSFTRLIDTTSNSLTIVTTADTDITGDVTMNNEENITINTADGYIDIGDTDGGLLASDLKVLTLVGDNNVDLIGDTVAADNYLSSTVIHTIDASGVTGTATVQVNASASTKNMTVTGSASTGQDTIVTGSGDDTITAGAGILSITSGAGADTIVGGAKADVITAGAGADTITDGAGADTITGGAGRDTITVTSGARDTIKFTDTAEDGANHYDVINGFVTGTTSTTTPTDILFVADASYALLGIGGGNNGTVAVGTGATVAAAKTNDTDATIYTISTDAAANTFDNFIAGTTTEATMEAAVLTAITSAAIDTNAKVLLAVDDGEDTALFYVATGDNAAIAAADMEIVAILQGVSDATDLVAGNFDFA